MEPAASCILSKIQTANFFVINYDWDNNDDGAEGPHMNGNEESEKDQDILSVVEPVVEDLILAG